MVGLFGQYPAFAEEPEVTFLVEPRSARIYYQATTTSGADQLLPLDDGQPGHPLKLRPEFFRQDRDGFTLIFRDPAGNYEDRVEKFGKYSLSGKTSWPEKPLQLQPVTLKGYWERFQSSILLVGAAFFGLGGLALRAWAKAQKAAKQAEESEARTAKSEQERLRQEELAKEQAARAAKAEEDRLLAERETEEQKRILEIAREDQFLAIDLDGYHLESFVAKGGMGRVYRGRAQHGGLPEIVAVKIMDPRGAPLGDSRRIDNEIKIHLSLEHPNIVRCYRGGIYKNHVYMILEWMPGGTLKSWVHQGGDRADRVIPALKPIFNALHTAHQKGVIHRDLKPENIMLAADGTPKVADFGVAKQEGANKLTVTGNVLGTSAYISPEQVFDSARAVPSSDQYTLGVMLFELLTGELPFTEKDDGALFMAHIQKDPPHLPNRADLTAELDRVIQRMLLKEPAERFPDLQACYAALEQAICSS